MQAITNLQFKRLYSMQFSKHELTVATAAILLTLGAPTTATAAGSRVDAESRATIAGLQAIGPEGIHELEAVQIGGIPQWISVRGNNRSNPILLFVHGGPGSPMMPESWSYQRPWEDFFTVVQWDQRGAGKTFQAGKRKTVEPLTIDRMQADGEELIELLRKRYHQEKIFLMGHSWGSVLGLRIAQHRPELLYAYVGVGQVVNGRRNEEVGYQETLKKARESGNATAVSELMALAPYPDPSGTTPLAKVIAERHWDVALGGMLYGKQQDNASQLWKLSPDYTPADIAAIEPGELASAQQLLPEVARVDFDAIRSFKCPIFFFAGVDDRTTPASIVAAYYQTIEAPKKQLFKIDHAAHYVINEAPGTVLVDLVNFIRPLAEAGRKQ